jgi:arylsulfatase
MHGTRRNWLLSSIAAVMAAAAVIRLGWVDRLPRLILLVSIDTLRADALSAYGNTRIVTPHLDRLAADGIRFAQAFAQSPWTIPSHASLLTSLYATVSQAGTHQALPSSAITLPELLRDRGYVTAAIVNTHYLGRKFGFDQGFDEFQEPLLMKGAPQVVDAALAFLHAHRHERVFHFMHLFDVHGPYEPPNSDGHTTAAEPPDSSLRYLKSIHYHDYLRLDRFQSLAELRTGYERGVTRVDTELGRLFADLKRRGVYDDALIVVTADHGEAFFEHGIWVGHGLFLYDTELHIPMILKLPKRRGPHGLVVDTPVSLIDVMPTILEVAGHAPAPSAQGQSLLRFATAPSADRNVFGHSTNTGNTEFVRSRLWKFIGPLRDEPANVLRNHLLPDPPVAAELSRRISAGPQLFDLSVDPNETTNVAAEHPALIASMERLLQAQRQRDALQRERHAAATTNTPVALTEGEREQLRSLGYAH